MEWFSNWWAALPVFEKILWCLAVPATALAVAQAALEMFGLGEHHADTDTGGDFDSAGHDADFDAGHHHGAPLNLFTVKGLIIFFAAFGWLGIAITRAHLPIWIALLVGSGVGLVCMVFFAWVFATLTRMSQEGNFHIKSTYARTGKVYLPIPAARSAKGKISIVAQGSLHEIDAITDSEEPIPTGSIIQVIDIINDQTVLVAKE
jgi:hypothetical protein